MKLTDIFENETPTGVTKDYKQWKASILSKHADAKFKRDTPTTTCAMVGDKCVGEWDKLGGHHNK